MEAKEAPSVHEIEVEPEPIPLTMATPGRNVTLVAVTGGRGLKSRLYGMGITPGVHLRILNGGTSGPFLVLVRDFKIALGYGVARKLMVR
ncbi:MAG TPA: FeoA family protein [Thermodesulfobacteriota bacterium]|nr:ferrous iron transport protein A [Deltaproteobacteria bacterium]HNR14057.1 FeoA family protein [Thermodesulfobacteriota bacterium]HNU71348.1 FeoA family protein [Thermodesulfobacteriota bacterium]HOC38976.1 FeoA family protein [Thermodesulfobacteriota bacterium]HQO77743.1 FeoA family protein [Thermodesulfobacteriota bacterium]